VCSSNASLVGLGTLLLSLPFLGPYASFTLLVLTRRSPSAPSLQADDYGEAEENGDNNDEGDVHYGYPFLPGCAPDSWPDTWT
jgi:hypothetical protein